MIIGIELVICNVLCIQINQIITIMSWALFRTEVMSAYASFFSLMFATLFSSSDVIYKKIVNATIFSRNFIFDNFQRKYYMFGNCIGSKDVTKHLNYLRRQQRNMVRQYTSIYINFKQVKKIHKKKSISIMQSRKLFFQMHYFCDGCWNK